MFCPKCRAEYRENFYECADCKIALVSDLSHIVEAKKESIATNVLSKGLINIGSVIFVLMTFGWVGSSLQRFNMSYAIFSIALIFLGLLLATCGALMDQRMVKKIPLAAILCLLFGTGPFLLGIFPIPIEAKLKLAFIILSTLLSIISGAFFFKHVAKTKELPAGITFVIAGLAHSLFIVLLGLLLLCALAYSVIH